MIVTCAFLGRCGNQLFQIAATLGYALEHGFNIGFPNRTQLAKEWPLYFKQLPRYNDSPKIWKAPDNGRYVVIPKFDRDIKLFGFFQSELYFGTNSAFRSKLYKLIGYEEGHREGCAIHVRRGDYLIHSDGFPVLPIGYYQKGIDIMRAMDIKDFTIFSDDPGWCLEHFHDMEVVTGNTPVQDLFEMSKFKHIITANSSFSWWGAWLGSIDKKVIVPHKDQYYGPTNPTQTDDLFPDRWTQLRF